MRSLLVLVCGVLLLGPLGCGRRDAPEQVVVTAPSQPQDAGNSEIKKRLVPRANYQGHLPRSGRAELTLLVAMN